MRTWSNKSAEEKVKRAEDILRYLDLTWEQLENRSILDVGAGSSELAEVAYLKGINILCLDKNVPPNHLNPNIKYVVANAQSMPFTDQLFDYVLSVGLLSDIPEIENTQRMKLILDEMKRILKPSGEIRFGFGIGNQDYIKTIEPSAEIVHTGTDAKGRFIYYYLIRK